MHQLFSPLRDNNIRSTLPSRKDHVNTEILRSVSRIVAQLHPGAALTTFENVVDCFVTGYGVAELRDSSIHERARKLISITHPKLRDGLTQQTKDMGYV